MTSTSIDKIARGEKPQTELARVSKFIDTLKPQLRLALPKHLTPDRMARLALTAMSQNPKLMECDPRSIAGSIVMLSQLGLEIGVNGHAYLVPYWDSKRKTQVCTPIPGWRGLVDLVNRSGRATVWTGAVFKGDAFDYELGDAPYVKHKPGEEDDPALMTHVYACGRVRGSERPVVDVWTIAKVWKHRNRFNKVGERHYSYAHPEMYARKIPLLQVLKYMPSSIELTRAVNLSDAAEAGEGYTIELGDAIGGGDFVDQATGEIVGGQGPAAAAVVEAVKSAAGNAADWTPSPEEQEQIRQMEIAEAAANNQPTEE